MVPIKPQRELLTIWRILLIVITVVPAFFNSLLFPITSLRWIVITCAWVLLFLGFYLFYFPVRYKKLSFQVIGEKIVLHNGVFYTNTHAIPLENIQFTTLKMNPLDRIFGLSALIVNAPGGRMVIPGLKLADAKSLAVLLAGERE